MSNWDLTIEESFPKLVEVKDGDSVRIKTIEGDILRFKSVSDVIHHDDGTLSFTLIPDLGEAR